MNEQAIIDSYNLFVQNGYKKSIEEYKQLLSSNPNAVSDSYTLFQQNGYKKSLDEYKNLMGVSPIKASGQEPEMPTELKKKDDTTELPSALGSSASSVSAEPEIALPEQKMPEMADFEYKVGEPLPKEKPSIKPEETQKKGGQGYVENLFTNLGLGAAYFNEGIASIPETAINLLAIPQNYVAEKTGWDIGVTADGIKESWGITNPLLDYVQEDKKILSGEVSKFIADRYEDPSVVGNFQKGNYKDGFELLGSAIAQSVPTSIGLMVGGAKMTPAQLASLSTIVFTEGQRQELAEMDPTMPEAERTFKALSMAAMEGVFSSIGTGTIGKVYKDILKREGAEAAPKILKDGLVAAYTKALEKTGPVAGFLGNSIEETAVQISQNVIAGRPAFEGAADAFVIGGGQGVVFTAPIGAINAKRYVQDKVESYQTKDKIGKILGEKADDIDKLYNVPVASEITAQQLEIANLPKSRDILVDRLKKAVSDNKITDSDAKQSLFVFDKTQQVSNAVKDLGVTVDDKAKIATLLRQRDDLKTKIQNKDDVLVVQEKQKIEEINTQIQEIITKPIEQEVVQSGLTPEERVQRIEEIEIDLKFDNRMIREGRTTLGEKRYDLEDELQTLKAEQDAFQEQAAGQVPVQSGATVSQEVAQGESQAEPQVTAEAGVQEEVKPSDEKFFEEMDVVFPNDYIGGGYAATDAEGNLLGRISMSSVDDNTVKIDEVVSEKRGQRTGNGSAIMRIVTENADKNNTTLTLTPNLIGGMKAKGFETPKKLEAFYEKFGFVKDKQKATMTRLPKQVEATTVSPAVSPQVELTDDQIVEYNPTEEVSDKNNEVLGKVLKSKKFVPQAEPIRTDLGDSVVFEYNNFDDDDTRTWFTFKKKKDGTITGVGVKVDRNKGDFRGTDLFRKYVDSKKAETIKQDTNESLPTERVQPELGVISPETTTTTKPTKLKGPVGVSPKREQVKSSIQRIANAGLLRSAETGKQSITEQEIDAQMALTDAMARVWQETSGKDDFYETFFEDVKEGDIEAIKQKGGALFQNTEQPQLPVTRVTLAVFELPEFQKMKGNMVAPQAVSDLMKSRGKQIEKDIVNAVLSYDKYQGQKRISFDDFKDDVETQLMKLERIDTTTYASYGMDNLGNEQNYGTAQTIIFNSPIDHGQFGHFRGDFNNRAIQITTWNIRQVPNTEQYVAIDANMPAGIEQNEMSQYVGTAGPLADVQRWVNDRNDMSERDINVGLFGHIRNWFNRNTGVYTLAELQSDYFQKNKANDLYASKIPQEEIDEYMNKNFRSKLDNETREIFKKELGIKTEFALGENGEKKAIGALDSEGNLIGLERIDSYATPPIGYDVVENAENRVVIEAGRVLARQAVPYSEVPVRYSELYNDYEVKRKELKKEEYKYIAKRIEDVKKSEAGNLMLSQFVASQKVHELRLFRESLKHAADKGASELWFPTPYTIAVIEGYVSDKGEAPYYIARGDGDYLVPGDLIDYGGTRMIVVDSGSDYITVVPRDSVGIYDIDDLRADEVDNRMNDLEYHLDGQTSNSDAITRQDAEEYEADEWMSENVKVELDLYFENNPEEETVSWNKIRRGVRDRVEKEYDYMTPQDLASWAEAIYQDGDTIYTIDERNVTENLGQPSDYESDVNEDDFEDQLSETQSTVVRKYDELGEMIRKMRPDAELIRDDNNKAWIRTAITAADGSNPVIAFQEEGGKIKGAIDFSNDNKASVYVFDGADISTLTHEMSGHLGRRVLEKLAETNNDFAKDYETAKKWAGVKDNQWTRAAEEKWARAFERYLRAGKAPSKSLKNVFEKLSEWLTNIYKTIKGSSIDIKLTPSITSVFDNLLATKEEQGKAVEKPKEDILEDAFGFLDSIDKGISKVLKTRANDALLGIPLTALQGMVKGLKALVQGGMKLRDAIKQVAEENNITQDKLKELLDLGAIAAEFNEVMARADKLIASQKSKNIKEKTILTNLETKLRKEPAYINGTDAQRKIMEREVRAKMGAQPRKAASIGRVIGALKDITNVTREEKLKIISRIRELGRDVTKDLAAEIRELASSGKITSTQAASIVTRTLKINPLNEASVTNFVDYMAKVFSKADYVGKMTTALSKIKQAKKNIKTKIGVAQDLFEPLNQLLSINPTLIPLNQLEKYLGILEDFGERKAVLTVKDRVKVLKQVNEILEEISNEQSRVDVLADMFNNYDGQVFNEEDGLNYAATIKKMVDDGKISTDEADLMKKYKSEILPQVASTPATDAEIEADKKKEIKILKALKIDNKEFPLPSRDEKEDALSLAKLIKELSEADLMNLSLTELKNIIKVIGNINNGYLPHYAKLSIEKLNSIKKGDVLSGAIENGKPLAFSKLYSRAKEKLKDSKLGAFKKTTDELIRANPLYYIDNVFGNFKTRDIFNSLFEESAQALSRFNSELKRIDQKIETAQNKVLASFRQNPDKYLMSKFRMTTYMLQREYESNVGKKGVKPVADYLKATIKHIRKGNSIFKEADAEKLQKILEEVESYTKEEGVVDLDKFYNTFNNAEKNAVEVMTEINASLGETASYTASVIRGNKVELMDNYFHHNVLHEQNPMDETAAPEFSSKYSNSMKPTTKAKSLIERTDALTPLNFDLFTSTQKGAKFVLLDYNMTSPIRTARRTLNQAERNLQKVADKKARDEAKKEGVTDEAKLSEITGVIPKQQRDINNAINNAYEEALQNILTNNISQDALGNEVIDFIQKQGYRTALAGTVRFKAELASNIANALLVNPKAFARGLKNVKLISSANGYEFMKNAKSKQTSRLYSSDALSGKLVDPQILKQTSGIKGSVSKGALLNRTTQIYNLTLKKLVQNPVEYIADTMLTTPDKVVSMPLWFGSFMNEFKRITGEEVNQEMMINNDLDYMQKNADAIEQATRKADQESVYSGATNNEFMGILKGKLKPDQSFTQKAWNNFNSFMTNFMNFDYAAARSAVYNLFNEGYMTKQKAAAVLAGITTRSVIYQVMVANMGAGLVGAALGLAFDWEDEEEVDEKSYLQMLGRGLTNVFVGYTLGRNFGNAVRGMINFGVEKVNEEYLDFLRNGEYDFYKDNIAYTYLNVGDRGDIDVPKMAISMAGAYTPALNTAVLIGKNFGAISSRVAGEGSTKKEPEAIRREDMTVNYRIPLEVAGNAGLIPLYKDIKKAVNDEIYKDLRKAANTPDSSIPSADEYDKLRDLRELKEKSRNQEERRAIDKKIVEIVGSEEAKAAIDKQKEALTAKKKRLLYDSSGGQRYNNESDMKRLNPALWRKRFGPNSDWNKQTKAKEAVESKLQKESTAREDKEFKKKKRSN